MIRQWRQLLALTFCHLVADLFVGMTAPVLVPLKDKHGFSLASLIFVCTLVGVASNILQIPFGAMRRKSRSVLPVTLGTAFAGCSAFIALVPSGHWWTFPAMVACAILGGAGTAAVHPAGLLALQNLKDITPSLTTAVFMVGGFTGFAGGGVLSAWITENFGLSSIVWLYSLVPVAIFLLSVSGATLPETSAKTSLSPQKESSVFSFAPLFSAAVLLAISTQLLATLLPSWLHAEVKPGWSLSFSGLSFTLFGVGSMCGGVLWGALAPKMNLGRLLKTLLFAGAIAGAAYLPLAPKHAWAIVLLWIAGFTAYSVFPFTITLARTANSKLSQGTRMGIMSGGSWGIAAAALWIVGPLAEPAHGIGMGPFLHLVWIGYLAALAILWRLDLK